jgi:IMP-specific 5'-nucleotidase
MKLWDENEVNQLLDIAQLALNDVAKLLRIKVKIVRKDKAVGTSLSLRFRFRVVGWW